MASPFSLFRKNQRVMMVVIGVGCMVGFLLGGMGIIEGIRPGMGGGGDPANSVVVSFDGGTLTQQDIDRLRGQRSITLRYLAQIARKAIENGGTPKGPGVSVSQGQMSLGIPQDTSDEDIVYTYLLAQKAKQKGFNITDDDVNRFLLQVSDEAISKSDFEQALLQVAGDNMTDSQLFESLRYELLSVKMRILGRQTGLAFSTPGELWQYYNRLNRQIEAELIALPVADFTDEVPTPSTAQLKAFYEQYKNAMSHPLLPNPGFRQRQQLAFGYFQASLHDFMEGPNGALAQVTDEEIEAYYEENKDRMFRERELPAADDSTPAADDDDSTPAAAADDDSTPAAAADDSTPAAEADPSATPGETELAPPANGESQPATAPDNASPDDAAPVDPAAPASSVPPETNPPADASPADASPADDVPPANDDGTTPPADAPPAADDSDTSRRRESSPATASFVSYLVQDEPVDETQPPPAQSEPAAEPSADPAPVDQPADASTPPENAPSADQPGSNSDPAPPAANDDGDSVSPAAAGNNEPAPPVANEPPADGAVQPPADPGIEAPATEPPQPKYTPLEKVRDEIRRSIATPKANQQMKDALAQAEERMQQYSILHSDLAALAQFKDDEQFAKEYAEHLKRTETERPDFEAIARDLGLTYGETPLVDQFEIENYPLGKVTTFDRNTFQQVPFASGIYGQAVQLYKPVIVGEQRDEQFLYWVSDQREPRIPTFAELYNEEKQSGPLLDAWKKQQALPLAIARAKELAAESNKTDKTLEEQFKGRNDVTVLKTTPFSWLTTGGMPLGFGQLQISSVAGAEHAGSEFMEAAFSLDVGQAGAAANQPHTEVYVIHVVGQNPSSEQLRTDFARTLLPPDMQQSDMAIRSDMMQQRAISQIAMGDRFAEAQQWFEDIEREMNVQWRQ